MKKIHPRTLYETTKADVILYKDVPDGTLYILKYDDKNRKRGLTVDKYVSKVDTTLQTELKSAENMFRSIGYTYDGNPYKVRAIPNECRLSDEYFCEIFNVAVPKGLWGYPLRDGVSAWTNHNQREEEYFQDIMHDTEDLAIQQEVKANPKESNDTIIFDVVKKRNAMDAAPPSDYPDSPEALAAFEEFERSVLPALERIQASDAKDRQRELIHLEDRIAKGLHIAPTGGVYFAWSDCLNCMKIGATRRETAAPRLRELSRHVTSPFTLSAWLPTPTPFRLEAQAHAFFGDRRIREAGAGTEFFRIGEAEARAYVARVGEGA